MKSAKVCAVVVTVFLLCGFHACHRNHNRDFDINVGGTQTIEQFTIDDDGFRDFARDKTPGNTPGRLSPTPGDDPNVKPPLEQEYENMMPPPGYPAEYY